MNSADSEIVASILEGAGMEFSSDINEANLILINTCAIRENAEAKIWHRLDYLNSQKSREIYNQQGHQGKRIIGVLGCMAERLKEKMVEKNKVVDMVVGPDAYRDIPGLVSNILVSFGQIFTHHILQALTLNLVQRRVQLPDECPIIHG